jgi:hypothetical protein
MNEGLCGRGHERPQQIRMSLGNNTEFPAGPAASEERQVAMRWQKHWVVGSLILGWLGCGESGDFALSAGAPVTAAVRGTIAQCGAPISGADVVLLVQQAESSQARPVDAQIGPVATDGRGQYLIEASPAFAVPGLAIVRLRVTPPGGSLQEFPADTVEFSLGEPARDTLRLDADLGTAAGHCE